MSSLRKEVAALRARLGSRVKPPADITDPVTWAERAAGIHLDAWQQGVLRSEAKRLALLCCRQSGKTESVSLLAAKIAAQGGAAVVVAPSLRQSSNLFRRLRAHLSRSGTSMTRETATEIATAGGGLAVCLPGDRPSMLRGQSLRHAGTAALIIDEAAFVKDELWPVASPMLAAAPDARLVLLSTPAGPAGEFHRIWSEEQAFEKVTVKAADCPRISPEFLEEERRRLGPLFAQEYECRFISSGASVFDASLLASLFDVPVEEDEPDIIEVPIAPPRRRMPAWLD